MLTDQVLTLKDLVRQVLEHPTWPSLFLRDPASASAESAALAVRKAILGSGAELRPLEDLTVVAEGVGIRVRLADLGAAEGGCEAVLASSADDRFVVLIDPAPRGGWHAVSQRVVSEVTRHRFRFRLAHEIGHTLFYARRAGERPARCRPAGVAEERFCDTFASALLFPRAAATRCSTPGELLRAQRSFDVSVELAVRRWVETHARAAAVFFWDCRSDGPTAQWFGGGVTKRVLRSWERAVAAAQRDELVAVPGAATARVGGRDQAIVLATA
jgi:hypothetical protein